MNSNSNSNINRSSPSKQIVFIDDENVLEDQAKELSVDRASNEGGLDVCAEGGLPPKREHNARPNAKGSPGVIVITEDSIMRRQISFAIAKLTSNEEITIRAHNQYIPKAIRMAEILKMRVEFLHQENELLTAKQAEAQKSDLDKEQKGNLITIKLSKSQLNKDAIGYQKPKPSDYKFATTTRPFQQRRDQGNFHQRPFDENRRQPFRENNRKREVPFGNARPNTGRFPHEMRSKDDGYAPRDQNRFQGQDLRGEKRENRGKSVVKDTREDQRPFRPFRNDNG
jgi:hypothetical protein